MSRKYRQQGYQDSQESRERTRAPRPSRSGEGPRSPRMPGMKKTTKCAMCGTALPPSFEEISYLSRCPNCGSDLQCCKNCVYFDPASRFECAQPIPKRVSPKDKRADCEFFGIRSTVEKIVSSSQDRPVDARAAFENLFKK